MPIRHIPLLTSGGNHQVIQGQGKTQHQAYEIGSGVIIGRRSSYTMKGNDDEGVSRRLSVTHTIPMEDQWSLVGVNEGMRRLLTFHTRQNTDTPNLLDLC